MAMETKDIKTSKDMERYVEGCLNDLLDGLSTKEETMTYMKDYTIRIIDIVSEIYNKRKP
jgi:mevalonate pyrophosphate decarboxylase